MYRAIKGNGDSRLVPQLVFAKLMAPGADEARFRVALYALTQPELDVKQVAGALHIRQQDAKSALEYWEGVGLLERTHTDAAPVEPLQRRRMNTQEANQAATGDKTLQKMRCEIERVFGGVVSQSDYNIFTTLYAEDNMPADLILLAATHSAAQGKLSARYIEKVLLGWRRDGITTYQQADAYLQTLARRMRREKKVAAMLGVPEDSFTLAERRKITAWYEEYGYSSKMIETARLAAGGHAGDIAYLNGILKKWHGKGYQTPRDVQQGGENRNIQVSSTRAPVAQEDDILQNVQAYVPLRRRGDEM